MVSKQEVEILERIFMLKMSVRFLKQGKRPFHNEAINLIEKKIKQLKKPTNESRKTD